MFFSYVGICKFLPWDLFVPPWGSLRPSLGIFSSQHGWNIFVPSVWDGLSGLFIILQAQLARAERHYISLLVSAIRQSDTSRDLRELRRVMDLCDSLLFPYLCDT